ncbi:MAG: flagellar M-ring protein FliF [Gammaproteobacteria bacterium]|nr:MAG: flagellar M-ring protein FliF [Gammaproteobacteria bacterium]
MAEAATGLAPMSTGGMSDFGSTTSMTILRQIGLMVGLAASVAFGVALVLWSQNPDMRPLGTMDRATSYEVVSYLEQNVIDYEVSSNGIILVDQSKYQRVQMELASQGISDTSSGDTILKDGSGFGVSQMLETARLVRSQELNLSRTIGQFTGISSAQVHLAIPKQTVFVSDRRRPTASVLLNLSSKSILEREQVMAIVDLVAGSIPNLTADKVTITDQYGRLHQSGSMSAEESKSRKQFEQESRRQAELHSKIEQILSPILGVENFTVQVNVSMSFVANESTSKFHNGEQPSLRSERRLETSSNSSQNGGIPGSLSNQPSGDDSIPENIDPNTATNSSGNSGNQHSETESNFELDTTINHTKFQTATIQRISVSVGLNNLLDAGGTDRIPRNAQEISRIERMIQGVINFNGARGDTVIVDAFDFPIAEPLPDAVPLEFYEKPLFKMLLKPVIALIGVLLLIFLVFKPIISKLTAGTVSMLAPPPNVAADQLTLAGDMGGMQLPPPGRKSLAQVDRARSAVGDDPAMVAQVVKSWMESDE